jgi:2-pyrone-4,6-dicarboxylate lactonase
VHVFGPYTTFPPVPTGFATPPDAPKERLFALHRALGIERCVVVQSMVHGHDNRIVEDVLEAGGGRYLGVARVPIDVNTAELARLAARGFRAVRFAFSDSGADAGRLGEVLALTRRLADVGLHLQVHLDRGLVQTVGPRLRASAVTVVIDHMARVDASLGPANPEFQALLRLLEQPRVHVKVSGIDRVDPSAHPGSGYPAGVRIARELVRSFPERCIWGLDWPHPNHSHVPDDAALVAALPQIAESPDLLTRLLVTNPALLYGFAPDA